LGTDPLAIFGTELFLRKKARGTQTHKGGGTMSRHTECSRKIVKETFRTLRRKGAA